MKRINCFVVFAMMIGTAFFTSCTNDEEYLEEETTDAKLQEVKMRILKIAAEYGFDDYQVDDNLLRYNLNITDKEIERDMRLLAYLPGTYVLENDGKGKYTIKGKVSKRRSLTRSANAFLSPAYETGSFDGRDSQDERFVVEGSFDYRYGKTEKDYFDAEFKVSCWETDKNGNNGHWSDSSNGTIIYDNKNPASGNIGKAGLGGTYVIEVKVGTSYHYYEVSVEGTHGDAHASMSARELKYSDPRVKSWREKKGR